MIAVDTSVWIDFFADKPTPQAHYLSTCIDTGFEEIALTDVVLTEILQGLKTDHEARRVEEHLSAFEVLQLKDLSDFRRAAALYRAARHQGVTIRRTSDCLIATVCIREQVSLLHNDIDFDRLASVSDLAITPCQ